MALFNKGKKKAELLNDPALPDLVWLEQGRSRYEALLPTHDATADTLLQGARARRALDDPAAALYFVVAAVERLEVEYVASAMAARQPGEGDRLVIGTCWTTFTSVQRQRPAAPVADLATETSARLTAMAAAFEAVGMGAELAEPFRNVAADLAAVAAAVVPPTPPDL